MTYTLHDHQVRAVEHLARNDRAGLFLPVGAGKTLYTKEEVDLWLEFR